ncbi:hypothetical protein [Afipia birgiae]|uniref:hypothetical protein n=1 Tax=Afipia birgiae TaxID=151414 RepID=UPI001FCB9D91|nr:hypothetical protein [Afipia birgiae]
MTHLKIGSLNFCNCCGKSQASPFCCTGSPQSKEDDDRMEAKIDAILLAVEPKKGDKLLTELDDEYEGRHTDSRFVRMLERKTARMK